MAARTSVRVVTDQEKHWGQLRSEVLASATMSVRPNVSARTPSPRQDMDALEP